MHFLFAIILFAVDSFDIFIVSAAHAKFARIIFNENANNNVFHAVLQDAHAFVPIHCAIAGIFTHSSTNKIAVLQGTNFREGHVSRFFLCFPFGSSRGCLSLFIYFYIFKHGSPVRPKGSLFGRQSN